MKGYSVHLLCHLAAAVLGAAAGVAAGVWWFGEFPVGLWLALGALLIGVGVLVLQNRYISALGQLSPSAPARSAPTRGTRPTGQPASSGRSAAGTLPELAPVAPPSALDERSNPQTRRM